MLLATAPPPTPTREAWSGLGQRHLARLTYLLAVGRAEDGVIALNCVAFAEALCASTARTTDAVSHLQEAGLLKLIGYQDGRGRFVDVDDAVAGTTMVKVFAVASAEGVFGHGR